jgi:signal transduction histidine kinase
VKHPRFRTRLFLILALFAFVPSILLTLAWSGVTSYVLPVLTGTGAWEMVAESGESAIRLARSAPGTPESEAALAVHEAQLGESRLQARRFRFLAERAVPAIALIGIVALALLTLLASRVAGHLSRQLSRPLDEMVNWTGRIARGNGLPQPLEGEVKGAPEFGLLRERMRHDGGGPRRRARRGHRGRAPGGLPRVGATGGARAQESAHADPLRGGESAQGVPPELRETVEVLDAESARLEAMARSFAQFGRLPEGPTAEVDLGELARETVRTTVPPGASARSPRGMPLTILGQHDALQRALGNVLLNALDATAAGGRIAVRVEGGDGT